MARTYQQLNLDQRRTLFRLMEARRPVAGDADVVLIVGPAGTFAPLPLAANWLLSAGMLLGRLELLTVLVLFTPRFWRR